MVGTAQVAMPTEVEDIASRFTNEPAERSGCNGLPRVMEDCRLED